MDRVEGTIKSFFCRMSSGEKRSKFPRSTMPDEVAFPGAGSGSLPAAKGTALSFNRYARSLLVEHPWTRCGH